MTKKWVQRCLVSIVLFGTTLTALDAGTSDIFPEMELEEINRILNRANPGDTISFHSGTYTGPFVLENLHGEANRAITIAGEEATIDGKSKPGMLLMNQAFRISNSSWISIENFTIKNCWTDLVLVEDGSYISLRNCELAGGKRALFATGRGSHHFLVEHCSWEQDPRVWTYEDDFNWDEVHHGIHQHYNGSLFQGSRISGVFVLRDNQIKNTFNAFRLSQINSGEKDPLACTNGEVYRNTILNTSDNVFEPELHARNLHFYHNHMINGHAFISITEVDGGDIYIYGNTAVSQPGIEDGWTIFKISSNRESLSRPLYIYNNSWQVDFDIFGRDRQVWKNNHIRCFNNATFSEKGEWFGIYDIGEDNYFDYNLSNLPFPKLLTQNGFEANGLVADPMFRAPYKGNFRLKAGSPCIDRGKKDSELIFDFHGKAPDIGAYDNDKLVEGKPFRFVQPDAKLPYKERPRITRHKQMDAGLKLWFSLPLAHESVKSTFFWIKNQEGILAIKKAELSPDGYCLTLTAVRAPATLPSEILVSRWIRGQNDMQCTSWASTLPLRLKTD